MDDLQTFDMSARLIIWAIAIVIILLVIEHTPNDDGDQ